MRRLVRICLTPPVEELQGAVRDLPGGRFKLRVVEKGSLAEASFGFLGHAISLEDGKPRVSVSVGNHEFFYKALMEFDVKKGRFAINPAKPADAQRLANCVRLYRYLQSWLAAFSLCGQQAVDMVNSAMPALRSELRMLGRSNGDLDAITVPDDFVLREHFECSGAYL